MRTQLQLATLVLAAAGCSDSGDRGSAAAAMRVPPLGGDPGPALASSTAPAGPLASFVCDAPLASLGSVWESALLDHAFHFEVGPGAPAVIERVKPGCSCTLVELVVLGPEGARRIYENGTPLAPGTELELVAELDTSGKRGVQKKPVTVYANVEGGKLVLELEADIRPFLEAAPPRWMLGTIATVERREGLVRVHGTAGEPFRLELDPDALAIALPPTFTHELVPLTPGADGRSVDWEVRLALGPGVEKGSAVFLLPLRTDVPHPEARVLAGVTGWHRLDLQVIADVVGVVTATPSYVAFGVISPDQMTARTLRVTSADPTHVLAEPVVRVLSVAGEPYPWAERFRVTARAVEGLSAWDLEIALDGLPAEAAVDGKAFRGRIEIETSHPGEPLISVPFSGFMRAATPPGQR